jgi:hypothetical protein
MEQTCERIPPDRNSPFAPVQVCFVMTPRDQLSGLAAAVVAAAMVPLIPATAFAAGSRSAAAPPARPPIVSPAQRYPLGKNAVPTAAAPARPPSLNSLPPAVLAPPSLPKGMVPIPVPATAAPVPPPSTTPSGTPTLAGMLRGLGAASSPTVDLASPAASDTDDDSREDLANRVRDLEVQLEQTRDLVVNRRPSVTFGGYVDFGFFTAQGDGSGIVRDSGAAVSTEHFGNYATRYGWIFLGDILGPTVNTRGEVADLGDSAGATRFDSIHSRGAPGFIANEVNLTMNAGISEQVLGTASVNFIPRSGQDFSLGDFMEVDIAQVEWTPTQSGKTSIFVGKFDSVLGIEYRDRKSNQRFGITPSLLARYTTGTALGLKFRSKFGSNDWLVIAGAVTNGSNTTEQFHFYNEIDTNAGKTASGRIALHYAGSFELELGGSGSYGAQDRARDSRGAMWFAGVDLIGHFGPVDLKAQWLKGAAPGAPMDDVYGLKLKQGAYLELDWMLGRTFGLIGRGELRDAVVWLGDPNSAEGANRVYITKSWRGTFGAKAVLHQRVLLKAEYLHNGEYAGIPAIANDVFTSSFLFSF